MPITDEEKQQVKWEIAAHDEWCGPSCQTFLPQVYYEKRLLHGYTKEQLQNDYDSCHIFR